MFGDGITSQAAGALGITRFVKERENDPSKVPFRVLRDEA